MIRVKTRPSSRFLTSLPTMQSAVESSAFRARMVELVSPLRSTRPRRPFWTLQSHKVPTLRLYRDLLRYSPNSDVRTALHPQFDGMSHSHLLREDQISYSDAVSEEKASDKPCRDKTRVTEGIQGKRLGVMFTRFYIAQTLYVVSGWTCSSELTKETSSCRRYLNDMGL